MARSDGLRAAFHRLSDEPQRLGALKKPEPRTKKASIWKRDPAKAELSPRKYIWKRKVTGKPLKLDKDRDRERERDD